jgi:hypothetical protein
MDSGLSERMDRALQALIPRSTALAPPKNYNAGTAIDLSNAQNEVLRSELQEFFKTTVEDKLSSQVSRVNSLMVASYLNHVRLSPCLPKMEEIKTPGKHLRNSSTPTLPPFIQ